LALCEVATSYGLAVNACHVNYGLRGDESDRDQHFCEQLCSRLKIDLTVKKCDASRDNSGEDRLRNLRYEHFAKVAQSTEAQIVTVGHTLDDQVETMLFRLLRGTAISGLRGMASARVLAPQLVLVRPMLSITRAQCLEFLLSRGIQARHDSSNFDPRYARNWVRHQWLPLIAERFPGFRVKIEQLRRSIASDDDFLQTLVQVEIKRQQSLSGSENLWLGPSLRNLHESMRRRMLVTSMRKRGIEATFERVDAIESMLRSGVRSAKSLNAAWDVRVSSSGDLWWQDKTVLPTRIEAHELRVPGETAVESIGMTVQIRELTKGDFAENGADWRYPGAKSHEAIVDLSLCEGPLELRSRQPGDVIRPFGMRETVRLKKYLHARQPAPEWLNIVIADRKEILWIPGVGISEKLRVHGSPTHHLRIGRSPILVKESD
jgi:tRNA(Ile)-lysidine synthase